MLGLALQLIIISACFSCLTCTLVYNSDCLSKAYKRLYINDNKLFDTGLLDEMQVGTRAECFPLCDRQENCNVVLYNNMTSVCRLHHYLHYNTTDAGTEDVGWEYFGVTCNTGSVPSDCNLTLAALSSTCQSCLDGTDWQFGGGGSERRNILPFSLMTGMAVTAQCSVNDPSEWIFFELQQHPEHIQFVGVEIHVATSELKTKSPVHTFVLGGSLPIQNEQNFNLTFVIKGADVQIFADDTFITTLQKPQSSLNEIYYKGINNVYQGVVLGMPSNCY